MGNFLCYCRPFIIITIKKILGAHVKSLVMILRTLGREIPEAKA